MIREKSKIHIIWNILLLILIPISCILIPLKTVFLVGDDSVIILIYVIDGIFILDIISQFFTSYKIDGQEVVDKKKIATKYFRSYFIFDLVANIPILYAFNVDVSSFLLIYPIFRLFRLVKFIAIVNTWKKILWNYSGYLRIIQFVLIMVVIIHWVACAWYLTIRLADFPNNSWLAICTGKAKKDSSME